MYDFDTYDFSKNLLRHAEKTAINDPLLSSLFNGKGGHKHDVITPLDGSGYALSRLYLTYLIQRLFSIHRLPGFHDNPHHYDHKKLYRFLESLSDHDIKQHLEELNRLYQHTQQQLKLVFPEGKMVLYRGLKSGMVDIAACAKNMP